MKCPPPARTKISDVDEQKRRIKNELANLNHAVMERAVGYMVPTYIRACVVTGGGRFEHVM